MTNEKKLYGHAHDFPSLEPYYSRHVSAMTSEALHSKSAIAAELAWRDAEIERLREVQRTTVKVSNGLIRVAESERDDLRSALAAANAIIGEQADEAKRLQDELDGAIVIREQAMRERETALSKVAAWREAMPCCQAAVAGNVSGICGAPATVGNVSHEPERCDAHRRQIDHRECDWAPLLRCATDPPAPEVQPGDTLARLRARYAFAVSYGCDRVSVSLDEMSTLLSAAARLAESEGA